MTPNEFKAWFDGFTEAIESAPNAAQWAKIKVRVGEINNIPVSYPVFVDRYWPRYRDPYISWTVTGNSSQSLAQSVSSGVVQNIGLLGKCADARSQGSNLSNFDSLSAMYAAGREDATQN